MTSHSRSDYARYGKLIKEANIQGD